MGRQHSPLCLWSGERGAWALAGKLDQSCRPAMPSPPSPCSNKQVDSLPAVGLTRLRERQAGALGWQSPVFPGVVEEDEAGAEPMFSREIGPHAESCFSQKTLTD